MGQLYEYQLWLTKQQRQPTFLNNYWCAMLAHEMEENKRTEGFKIPYFIVEKELMREDNNVHLTNQREAYVSPALRHWLIQLLKAHNSNTSSTNYEEVLRNFLETETMPPVSRPLTPSTSFHSLPSECKLWIFYKLWNHRKPARPGKTIATDPLSNSYFIASGCRLYVALARSENVSLPIDEARLNREPWGPLYRFVHNQPCRLLCENQDGWSVVLKTLQFYNLTNLCYSLLPEITAKLTEQTLLVTMRDEERRAFEESFAKRTPNAGEGKHYVQNQKRKQKKKERAALEAAAAVNAVEADLRAVNIQQPATAPTPQTEEKPRKQSGRRKEKCWQFPQCQLGQICPYVHPRNPCTKFPNCPRGWLCLFLHEFCPNDAYCVEPNCPYEHIHSKPTYYRAVREQQPAVTRPVASVSPTVRKVSDQKASENTSRPPMTPENNQPNDQRVRCGFYPNWCRKGSSCEFFHPTENCRMFAAGNKCPGQRCLFLHGVCPNDGCCDDLRCIYEHYESKPVVERRIAANQQKQGSLSRATSMSNLSTISTRSRKKSVSFDFSDDESTDKKPVGILRAHVAINRERCQFFMQCTKVHCEYTHPTEKCKAFPKCPNGGACMFLHDVCKNDGVCTKQDCDFEHHRRNNVTKRWCNKGSRCLRIDCTYLHPKDCTGRCPSPGNCWMRHLAGSAAIQPTNATKTVARDTPAKAAQKDVTAPKAPAPPNTPKQPQAVATSAVTRDAPPPVPPRHSSTAPLVSPNPPRQAPPQAPPSAYPPPANMPHGQGGWGGPQQFGPLPGTRYGYGPDFSQRPGPEYFGYGTGMGQAWPGYGGYGAGGHGPRPGDAPPPNPDLNSLEREKIASNNRR